MSGESTATPFSLRTVLVLVLLGVVGFVAFLLLTAYADDLQPAQRPGNHALATSAIGFAGAAELVRQVHGAVKMVRRDAELDTSDILVVTLEPTTSPDTVKRIVDRRAAQPTILVLPKWLAMPRPDKPAWVTSFGTLPVRQAVQQIAQVTEANVQENADGLRTISGEKLEPVIGNGHGGALVATMKDQPTLIVADPDLLDNQGLKTLAGAERAMQLLDWFDDGQRGIAFDLTLHGFGSNPNLLKLAFEPPFLPLTLCLLVAALLAGWHALLRFGPALPEARGVAFGKRAIAENGAALLRLAGRRHRTGDRYAALIRDAAASATAAPANLPPDALDNYLDRLDKQGEPFTALAARAGHAQDTRALLDAARALYQWKRTVTREH
ncbi:MULTISPECIES: hypothetical protein [unclassified Sphingomonas]|nr:MULTISPECIES: hypothetical protein [unclassified Sphingomonas]